jgi:manganese/iron transport system permease protein/iron/zinc/copper transport system permease protein
LDHQQSKLVLTNAGQLEAIRLRRAHRLWETYLQQAGTPDAKLHETAHLLEHVNDPQAIDYLDDKLGHPIRDPHGSLIPQDFQSLVKRKVLLSKLRQGHRAKINKIEQPAAGFGLDVGQIIEVGPRLNDGFTWTVEIAGHKTIQLTHEQADALLVEVIEAN